MCKSIRNNKTTKTREKFRIRKKKKKRRRDEEPPTPPKSRVEMAHERRRLGGGGGAKKPSELLAGRSHLNRKPPTCLIDANHRPLVLLLALLATVDCLWAPTLAQAQPQQSSSSLANQLDDAGQLANQSQSSILSPPLIRTSEEDYDDNEESPADSIAFDRAGTTLTSLSSAGPADSSHQFNSNSISSSGGGGGGTTNEDEQDQEQLDGQERGQLIVRSNSNTNRTTSMANSADSASVMADNEFSISSIFSHIDKAEVVLIVVFAVVLNLITIIGNIMVLISFKMDRSLQTVSNYFLLSLALADLLIGLISMPLYTLYLLLNYWPLGPLMCDLWLAIDYLNSNAAVLNMLIISFDRYFSVTRPLTYRARRTTKHACLMISCAWILSFSIWTPAIFTYPYYKGRTVQGTDKCEIEFVKANTYLTFVTAILAFYIPVIIMIYLYWRIWLETKKRYRDLTTLFLVSGVGAAAPVRSNRWQSNKAKNKTLANRTAARAVAARGNPSQQQLARRNQLALEDSANSTGQNQLARDPGGPKLRLIGGDGHAHHQVDSNSNPTSANNTKLARSCQAEETNPSSFPKRPSQRHEKKEQEEDDDTGRLGTQHNQSGQSQILNIDASQLLQHQQLPNVDCDCHRSARATKCPPAANQQQQQSSDNCLVCQQERALKSCSSCQASLSASSTKRSSRHSQHHSRHQHHHHHHHPHGRHQSQSHPHKTTKSNNYCCSGASCCCCPVSSMKSTTTTSNQCQTNSNKKKSLFSFKPTTIATHQTNGSLANGLSASGKTVSILSSGFQLFSETKSTPALNSSPSLPLVNFSPTHQQQQVPYSTLSTRGKVHPSNSDVALEMDPDDEGQPEAASCDQKKGKQLVDVATSPINSASSIWQLTLMAGGAGGDEREDFETRISNSADKFCFESNDPKFIPLADKGGDRSQPDATSGTIIECKYCVTGKPAPVRCGAAGSVCKQTIGQHQTALTGSRAAHKSSTSCCCADVISAHDAECRFCRPITMPDRHFMSHGNPAAPPHHHHHHHHHNQQQHGHSHHRQNTSHHHGHHHHNHNSHHHHHHHHRDQTQDPTRQRIRSRSRSRSRRNRKDPADEKKHSPKTDKRRQQLAPSEQQPRATFGGASDTLPILNALSVQSQQQAPNEQQKKKFSQKLTFSDILVEQQQQQQSRQSSSTNKQADSQTRMSRNDQSESAGDKNTKVHDQQQRQRAADDLAAKKSNWLAKLNSFWARKANSELDVEEQDEEEYDDYELSKQSADCEQHHSRNDQQPLPPNRFMSAICGKTNSKPRLSSPKQRRHPTDQHDLEEESAHSQHHQENSHTDRKGSKQASNGSGSGNNQEPKPSYSSHHPIQPKSERKAAKTLSTLLLVFIVTWLPYNVLVLIKTLSGGEDQVPEKIWNFSYYLCYINSTINPLCYALCNAQFRRTYMRILKCKLSNEHNSSARRLVPLQSSTTWSKDLRLNSANANTNANNNNNTEHNHFQQQMSVSSGRRS